MRTPLIRDIAAILVAAAALLLPGLGAVDLFNPDEPREAEIAREMQVSGDVVVPTFNDCPFLEKPPLFYWAILIVSALTGLDGEIPARLPSVLAGAGLLVVTYLVGRELADRRTGRAAALLLLTTFQFWWLARRALLDMTLAFFVGAALYFLFRGLRAPRGSAGFERLAPGGSLAVKEGIEPAAAGSGLGWFLLAGLAASGAVLTKGLIGLLIPAVTAAAYFAWKRDWRAFIRPGTIVAGTLPVAVLAVWVGLLGARTDGGAFVEEFLVENHVRRFLGGGRGGHAQPFWYYAESLATDLLPWVLFLPIAVVALWPGLGGWRRPRLAPAGGGRAPGILVRQAAGPTTAAAGPAGSERGRGASLRRRARGSADPFLHAWLLAPLLVLSLASTKRSIYLLPLAPAAALLVASWWRGAGAALTDRLARSSRTADLPRRSSGSDDAPSGPAEGRAITREERDPESSGAAAPGSAGEPAAGAARAGPREAREHRPRGLAVAIPSTILLALGVALSCAVPFVIGALATGGAISSARDLGALLPHAVSGAPTGAGLLLAVLAAAFLARRDPRRGARAALFVTGVFLLTLGVGLLPLAEPRLSARSLAQSLHEERARGATIAAHRLTEGALGQFLYYSEGTVAWIGRRRSKPESDCCDCRLPITAEDFLSGSGRRVCLMLEEEHRELPEQFRRKRVLARGRVGGSAYVLVASGAPSGS